MVGGAPHVTLVSRYAHRRFERGLRYTEQRLGGAPMFKWMLRYVFPDHWTFLIGEIALYSFLVLIGTGVFLAVYYVPSDHQVVYHGTYALLRDQEMPEAYRSVVTCASASPPACCCARSITGRPTCSSPRSCCT